MTRVAAGTPRENARTAYTREQYQVLEQMKDPGFSLGVARAEFVNHVLLPDGTVTTDVAAMRAAVQENARAAVDAANAHAERLLAAEEGSEEATELAKGNPMAQAQAAIAKITEVGQHIAAKRFLFVVDADLNPLIYFQCDVPGNEAIEPYRLTPEQIAERDAATTAPAEG